MEIKELYARYGELMLQFESIQNQINIVKQDIIKELNKPKTVEEK